MADSQLIIKIAGDISDFSGKLETIAGETGDLGTSMTAMAGVAAAAFAAIIGGITYSLEKYKLQEEATNRLTLALQNQGLYSDQLMQSYQDQANELSRLTGYDTTAIEKGQAMLQSMIGQTVVTKQMTQAALDLSSVMGGDVNAGFEIIGRAIDGNVRGLKQFGIVIDQHLTQEERTKEVLEKVTTAFGGMAEKMNSGLGSTKGLGAAMADFAADIGSMFAPAVTSANKALTDFFGGMHQRISESETLDGQIKNLTFDIDQMNAMIKSRPGNFIDPVEEERLKRMNAQLDILKAKQEEMRKGVGSRGMGQDPSKKAMADRAEADKRDLDMRQRAALLSQNAFIEAQSENHTKTVIDIYKEEAKVTAEIADNKNSRIKESLQQHLGVLKILREGALEDEKGQSQIFYETLNGLQTEHNNLSLAEDEKFMVEDRKILMDSILTENQASKKFLMDEMKLRITNHNTRLVEEKKFGVAYAAIHSVMNSEIYQGQKQAFSDLAQMTQSHNDTLKTIGKIASVANIVMKTAESAMNIYAGFSTIPIVGPALGIAGAAAAVAFGAEQMQAVTAAAQGGVMQGGIPGVDSIPTLTMPGELVVPTKNFDEVVDAVASRRNGDSGGGGASSIMVGFDGYEAGRVITIRQNAQKALGTYVGSS